MIKQLYTFSGSGIFNQTQASKLMKRFLLSIIGVSTVIIFLSSCAAVKKDCRGNKHYRLSNGIYM
jgi:hypothetical protein